MSLTYLSNPADFTEKERLYLEVRRREGRVLSDAEVLQLPDVHAPGARGREWRWRNRSFRRLDIYLKRRSPNKLIRVLDLGCGNGWMANLLAANPLRSVMALDLNETELLQGRRVFQRDNLQFVYGDVLAGALPERSFEIIVLAASVQYFPNLPELLGVLKGLLTADGELHMLDSHFYENEAARAEARERSGHYYKLAGVPEMAAYYHHHLWKEAQELGALDLNAGPGAFVLRKLKYLGPFPWLRIIGSTQA